MTIKNPFGFTTGPVTFWLIVVYAAFLIPLVWIHESVPAVPSRSKSPYPDVNLTEAWHDLTHITRKYHPYNSRANEEVGAYLLKRIEEILIRNKVEYTKEKDAGGVLWSQDVHDTPAPAQEDVFRYASTGPAATIFDDMISNTTYLGTWGALSESGPYATYFEGTNKLVYIRGTEDEDGEWWNGNRDARKIGQGGVLVNAHYDSVSTGYGATDDGMGCVSILQMLNYYTSPGRQPRRGIVLLLNNGEEDGLFGARAYHYSPLYHFTTSFVNLEGAGAGGRAILFRTTDLEVTKGYTNAPHPFGSVVAADGFKLGVIKSETDYKVWAEDYGQRGLDIAFYRPRARYHTNQDDTRHASQDSLWHLLSNSLAAVDSLQSNTRSFTGKRSDGDKRKVSSGSGADGVWFDMFGKGFAVLELRGLFAWMLTLLIVSPLVLALVTYVLSRKDKYYFFSRKVKAEADDESVSLGGWKGFFRFPLALVFSASITALSALLIRRLNPHIIYSSPYAIWAMTLSLFFLIFWTISKGASAVRPSALQRGYAHIWLFILSWTILVAATTAVDRFNLASGYPFAFFHSAVFVATLISLCDLFALPSKEDFAQHVRDEQQTRGHISEVPNSDALISPHSTEDDNAVEEPTETTPLRSGENENGNNGTIRTTFATTYRRSLSAIMSNPDEGDAKETEQPYEKEQQWSTKLPSWTWFFQLLLLAPITIIVFLQIGLFIVSATNSGAADGQDPLLVYAAIVVFSIVVLLPITPFIHRASFYLPLFLLLVFFISLIYNLVASPFSAENRLKVRFRQRLNLDSNTSSVAITGLETYVRKMIAELPSAAGREVECTPLASGLSSECKYDGSAVMPELPWPKSRLSADYSVDKYADLITVNISRSNSSNEFELLIDAEESKMCILSFDDPVLFDVHGSAGIDPIFSTSAEIGVSQLMLWRRDSTIPWRVAVETYHGKAMPPNSLTEPHGSVRQTIHEDLRLRKRAEMRGKVSCQWSDANTPGTIPALDEALQFSPDWIAVTKMAAGLVEVEKEFRG